MPARHVVSAGAGSRTCSIECLRWLAPAGDAVRFGRSTPPCGRLRHHGGVLTADARAAFERFVTSRGSAIADLAAQDGVEAMLDWYGAERGDDTAPIDADGDMLLFQWGTHDWGSGASFEYDITRQLVVADEVDDDAIFQLSLTFRFPPDETARALGSGDRWCSSPAETGELRRFIEACPASPYARAARPSEVALRFENAG